MSQQTGSYLKEQRAVNPETFVVYLEIAACFQTQFIENGTQNAPAWFIVYHSVFYLGRSMFKFFH